MEQEPPNSPNAGKPRTKRRRWPRILLLILLLLISIPYFYFVLPFWGIPFNYQRHTRVPVTPAWALECWLWEDDENTAARVDELLAGYAEHDIPVRTILLDSPWSMRYNDFNIDETRYPNPDTWFREKEEKGYRVVLWMTCMVDSQNKDTAITDSKDWFEAAKNFGYVAGDGYEIRWWKGKGGFIDYTNPEAMKWWRGMQQRVFDLGIDGWKLDGADTLFSSWFWKFPLPYQRVHSGWMTTRGYMDHYYRDEYRHGLTQNSEFLTLARSIDRPYSHPEGFAPLDAAPVTWVGDQDHKWKSAGEGADPATAHDLVMQGDEGIEEAMRDILLAAKKGYCVIGSDVAGFGGGEIPPRLYIRWAQFSTFCGLFLNGGHGERALWKRSPEELEIIRKFSWLHTELIPYMYSHVVECASGGKPLQRPIDGPYHYLFGDDFLVAPIYQDSLTNTVHLPKGRWRYFFDDSKILEGPTVFTREFPLDEYPVYIRDGAIVPMKISRAYTGIGEEDWGNYYLTLNIYPHETSAFTVHHPYYMGSTHVTVREGETLSIELEGTEYPHLLRVYLETEPVKVLRDGKELEKGVDWEYREGEDRLIVKCAEGSAQVYQIR